MTPEEFVAKWRPYAGKETAGYAEHFIDLCHLVGHATPAEADSTADWFCFQKAVEKDTGRPGFADVYFRRHFGWEYKGNHRDLEEANRQLLQYRENLENPPLLIVSDFTRFVVRTNFTNSITKRYEFTLDDLVSGERLAGQPYAALELLRLCFLDPTALNPAVTPVKLTEGAASQFSRLADSLRDVREVKYDPVRRERPREYTDEQVAKFLTRLIFCMFASDVGLLPANIVTRLIDNFRDNANVLRDRFSELFARMATGGVFGTEKIEYFDGGLFNDAEALAISSEYVDQLRLADQLDWSDIEPSIFGTLFERILDPKRRKQIGAHYTSRDDIELLVRPVLMEPLERDWDDARAKLEALDLGRGGSTRARRVEQARALLQGFIDRLAGVRVLDPACGSGNFLYVSLALLKELEQKARTVGAAWGITGLVPKVHPRQLYGIEVDPYAHELASIVVWIGYLQWKKKNGVPFETETPILEPFTNFIHMDALVARSLTGGLSEPEWPAADVIVGNPPFLGGKKLRAGLGDDEVDGLFEVWDGRVSREADLCCYFFEKARAMVAAGTVRRAGLLATQAIRGGKNREVLKAIKRSGDIFFAVDDRQWILDGAAVRVSMVGFDDGSTIRRVLIRHRAGAAFERAAVEGINADLTATAADVTQARRLPENAGISFMGDTKVGPFDIDEATAQRLLRSPNPDARSNADVIRPWVNGLDITRAPRGMWIVDFPPGTSVEEAAKYEAPFEYVKRKVQEGRTGNKRATYADNWWIHGEARPAMRAALSHSRRYLATPRVTKHRLFVWLPREVLSDAQLIVFAREDDYFFGVLHARAHEAWARATGTQLREAESGFRYTPTTCFETFPLPWPPGHEPVGDPRYTAIAEAARELDRLREGALHPAGGGADAATRTLTGLYNARPQWLIDAHRRLDEAVFAAYGWPESPANLADEAILARLLDLNLSRAGS